MTNKELAEDLRYAVEENYSLDYFLDLADKLDPQRPGNGTLVWWRDFGGLTEWDLGKISEDGRRVYNLHTMPLALSSVETKPARILFDDEVAVQIPPTHTWGHRATDVEIVLRYWDVQNNDHEERAYLITRAEAQRMERER